MYFVYNGELTHYGVLGMRWGVRRFQNPNGTLTPAGKEHRAKWIAKERKKIDKQYDYYDKKYSKKSARAAKRGDKETAARYESMRKENASDRAKATKDLDSISFDRIRETEREKIAKVAKAASIAATVGVGIAASPAGSMIAGYAGKKISDVISSNNVSQGRKFAEGFIHPASRVTDDNTIPKLYMYDAGHMLDTDTGTYKTIRKPAWVYKDGRILDTQQINDDGSNLPKYFFDEGGKVTTRDDFVKAHGEYNPDYYYYKRRR